uniref:Uncharacterized protein n=1 Tax=Arundo donax TaxID=35708 RepID=A0A0A9HU29_ARUDO
MRGGGRRRRAGAPAMRV